VNSPDAQNNAPGQSDLYDVSRIADLTDDDLLDRRRRLARIEREEFHRHLSSRSFIATVSHSMNEPLEEARWAMDKEIRRRRLD
jgi:hypothetical protein